MKQEGKVALVTGSGRNIGRATELELAREGANVAVNSRSNGKEAEAVAQEARSLGVKAIAVLADVSDKGQVDSMMARALEEFGRLDILVSNAQGVAKCGMTSRANSSRLSLGMGSGKRRKK